jgi:hypothetical protein
MDDLTKYKEALKDFTGENPQPHYYSLFTDNLELRVMHIDKLIELAYFYYYIDHGFKSYREAQITYYKKKAGTYRTPMKAIIKDGKLLKIHNHTVRSDESTIPSIFKDILSVVESLNSFWDTHEFTQVEKLFSLLYLVKLLQDRKQEFIERSQDHPHYDEVKADLIHWINEVKRVVDEHYTDEGKRLTKYFGHIVVSPPPETHKESNSELPQIQNNSFGLALLYLLLYNGLELKDSYIENKNTGEINDHIVFGELAVLVATHSTDIKKYKSEVIELLKKFNKLNNYEKIFNRIVEVFPNFTYRPNQKINTYAKKVGVLFKACEIKANNYREIRSKKLHRLMVNLVSPYMKDELAYIEKHHRTVLKWCFKDNS